MLVLLSFHTLSSLSLVTAYGYPSLFYQKILNVHSSQDTGVIAVARLLFQFCFNLAWVLVGFSVSWWAITNWLSFCLSL